MDGYGQFCPVSLAAETFARRWTPLIIRELLAGSTRFNDLRRGIPNISASVLSRRLDELRVAGIVSQRDDERGTSYTLTPAGEELRAVIEQLGIWGRRWLPTEYRDQDLDPRLLVWDMHRLVVLDEVPRRTLIELYFPDAPAKHRAFWLILTPDSSDVCLTHPGGDTDLRLTCSVRTLTNVWMGHTTWASALRTGALTLTGPSELRRALPRWLKLNPFANVSPVTATATDSDRPGGPEHPWRGIDLDVYEQHMSDARVGQLQRLHDITRQQLEAFPCRRIGVLGIAGGNGLDLINPDTTDAVFGYDINGDYLEACATRYRDVLGDRLHLIETSIDRSLTVERVDLLIANLIVEYVGVDEFAAFVAANAGAIAVLSCVIQHNDAAGFVSSTEYASSFDGLASVSSDIDADTLASAMSNAGFAILGHCEYPLPNGKTLIRHDFGRASQEGL